MELERFSVQFPAHHKAATPTVQLIHLIGVDSS